MPKHSMMLHQSDRLSRKSQLSVFSSLIFRHAVAVLLLTHPHGGHSQQMGQPQPIVATVGDDITLPCHAKPATDAVNMMLEWSRPDLNPRFVHVRRSGDDHLVDQNPSYRGRTSVSIEGLKQGDMSLKLSKVKLSDEGTYRCYVPESNTDTSVQLVVGAVIEITKVGNGELECKSKGWHPEPQVLWLDGGGNLLSAEPAAAVGGPDDLYTVSSRVTAEKRHGNNFTCRVQQKDTNHRRETYIYVTDDFLIDSSSSSAPIIIGVFVGIMFILAVAFIVWKWNKNKTNNQNYSVAEETRVSNSMSTKSEKESLMTAETDREKTAAGGKTMKNHNEAEEENNTESQPEKLTTGGQSDSVRIQVQSAGAGTGSQSVMENGGETMNDSEERSMSEDTQTPDQAEREASQEKPEENVGRRKAEEGTNLVNAGAEGPGAMDGEGQQQDTAGGETKTAVDKEEDKEQKQSTNNEPADQGATDGEIRENDPRGGGGTDTSCPPERGGDQGDNRYTGNGQGNTTPGQENMTKPTNNKTAGHGSIREEPKAGGEKNPEEDTNSVSKETGHLSSEKTETNTTQHSVQQPSENPDSSETAKDVVTEDRMTDDGSSV